MPSYVLFFNELQTRLKFQCWDMYLYARKVTVLECFGKWNTSYVKSNVINGYHWKCVYL